MDFSTFPPGPISSSGQQAGDHELIRVFSAMRQFIVSEHLHEPVTCWLFLTERDETMFWAAFPLTRLSSATSSTLTGSPQQTLTISQTGSGAPASWDATLRATSSYHGLQSCCSHFLFIPPWISIASNATLIQSCKHICRKKCATEWEMDVLPSFTIGWNTQTNGNDV